MISSDDILNDEFDNAMIFLQEVFIQSDKENASDIHVTPKEDKILVRTRVHGELKTSKELFLDPLMRGHIISTLKQVARLKTSNDQIAQDSAFTLNLTNSRYRACLAPSVFGESIVLRIIKDNKIISLDDMNLPQKTLKDFRNALQKRQGLIIVTGPTGEGKTTTLQSGILELDRETKNIITLEDPVERILPGITQHQITPLFTWRDGIKAAMRLDPDIILVGEIRDKESAQLALEASQTGHLVLTTLHTNDVAGTVDRLIGFGIDKRVIADNLLFVTAQRLEKKICPYCMIERNDYALRGDGCSKCQNGIIGRVPIIEYSSEPDPMSIINFNKQSFEKNEISTSLQSERDRLIKMKFIDGSLYEKMYQGERKGYEEFTLCQ